MWIGWLGAVLSLVSIFLAILIPVWLQNAWKRPFRALERDCEDMWEKVESHLGRISRLRRTDRSPSQQEIASAVSAIPTTQQPVLTRSGLLRRFRAKQTSDGTLR